MGVLLTPERASAALCWGFMALLALVGWPLFILFVPFALVASAVCCCHEYGSCHDVSLQCMMVALVLWVIYFYNSIMPEICPKDEKGGHTSWHCVLAELLHLVFRIAICLGSEGRSCDL